MSEQAKTSVPKLRFPEFKHEDAWKQKKLKELFEIGSGKDYKHLSTGEIPVYGSGGYMLSVDDYLYDGESVCIGRKGTIDKPMLLNGKFWTVDTLFYTHSFKACSPRFIFSIFQNIDWLKHNEAGGVPSLSKTTINEITAYIPKPTEQQKIADCLSSLDDLITAQNQKVEALKQHKKGLMQQLFPADGETVPKLRFTEFRNKLGWEEKQLKHACDMQAGKFVQASEIKSSSSDDLYPCYGGNGLRGYTKTFTHEGTYSLIGRQGALCGNINFVSGLFHATEHALVTTPKNGVDTNWLFYKLELLNLNQYATGQAQPGLSVENLERIEIKIPRDLEEQQEIAKCLSALDKLINVEVSKADLLKRHKKSLMQQLFPMIEYGEKWSTKPQFTKT